MKVLFLGLGSIGQRHLRNLKSLIPEIEIFAYRSVKGPTLSHDNKIIEGTTVEKYYHINKVKSLKEGLEKKPNIVFITNPSSLHLTTLNRVLRSDTYIFVEKPVADNFQKLRDLIKKTNHSKLNKIFVGYQYRFNPVLIKLKNFLDNKFFGEIISVRCINGEYLPNWHPYEDYKISYASKRSLGGGALLTQIHDFDYIVWLFGIPKSVYCIGGKLSNLNIDVEDTVQVNLQMKNKVPISINLNYLELMPNRSIQVIGDEGTIYCDLIKNTLTYKKLNKKKKKITFKKFDRNQMFIEEMKSFINFVRYKKENKSDIHNAMKSLYLVHKSKISLQKKLPEICKKNEI